MNVADKTYDPTPARRIACIGLGTMGAPMAAHLQRAGHTVEGSGAENDGRGQQRVEGDEEDQPGSGKHLEPVEIRIPASRTHDMHGGINGHTSSEIAEPLH